MDCFVLHLVGQLLISISDARNHKHKVHRDDFMINVNTLTMTVTSLPCIQTRNEIYVKLVFK